MTSWQDQPPQTRRQARESRRAAERELGSATPEQPVPVSRRAATVTPTPAGEVPEVATPYSFASSQRVEGTASNAAPADAPLSRPRTPRYDDLSFDTLLTASHAGSSAEPNPGSDRAADRATAVTFAPTTERAATDAPTAFAVPPSSAPVQEERPAPLPTVSPVDGHPLTRRELRAMLQAQAANEAAGADTTSAEAMQQNAPAAPHAAAPVVVPTSEPTPAEPTHRVVPPAAPLSGDDAAQQTPISAVPAAGSYGGSGTSPALIPEALTGQTVAQAPATPGRGVTSMSATGPATDPQVSAHGAGHWSTMNEEESDTGGMRRSAVASGSVTTANALILPSIPATGLSTSPLTSTGEVIVTGSIDLPKSLGSTGQHPDHFDSSDIDRLFEESDAGASTSGVAPVRASKAIATHTSTRGMITPPKARGNKLPVVLAVTAAFLAIGVAALLVAGFVFHAF